MAALRRRTPDPDLALPGALHPVLERVYRQRGLADADELDLGLDRLLPPEDLKGAAEAAALLAEGVERDRRILLVGDFDADGATGCALGVRALRGFGAAHVDYIVPNRFEYGYGLTPEIVELARARRPEIVVTVDNGISSVEGVAAARAAGARVIVTDHHLPGAVLPAADAIVDPSQPGCGFASKALAGVGVIFYVMLALRAHLRGRGRFAGRAEPNLAALLDLVALGTVADVVPMDRNNRILLRGGLRRIRAGLARPGVAELLRVSGRDPRRAVAADLGFAAGPRLNAAGRLDDMALGIECLLADTAERARPLAARLDGMNRERREIEADMREQAFQALEERAPDGDRLPAALCLFDRSWHEGVTGLVAARVRERFHRPAAVFAETDRGRALKGSLRSIPGFHVRDALAAVAAREPGLIERFGGHAMAAGLSLERDRLEDFERAFQAEAERSISPELLAATVTSDGELGAEHLNLATAEALERGGPWGPSFPAPLFDGRFRLVSQRRVGDRHLKMVLRPSEAGSRLRLAAIAFNVDEAARPPPDAAEIRIAYRLEANEYLGETSLQLVVEHILPDG